MCKLRTRPTTLEIPDCDGVACATTCHDGEGPSVLSPRKAGFNVCAMTREPVASVEVPLETSRMGNRAPASAVTTIAIPLGCAGLGG